MNKLKFVFPALLSIFLTDPMFGQALHGAEDLQTLAVKRSQFSSPGAIDAGVQSQPGFTRQLLQVQWRPGDPIDLYVVRPENAVKPPAVVFLYSWPDDTDRFRSDAWCRNITSHGFAAVGIVSALTGQRYHDRGWSETFVSQLPEALVKTTHDIQLLLDYLESRADLDTSKVGIFGQGSGGTIALLAGSVDSRLKAIDVIDPWGDWPDWFRTSSLIPDSERAHFTGPVFLKSVAPYDPVATLAALPQRSLRLQQTAFNATTPEPTRDVLHRALSKGTAYTLYTTEEDYRSRAMKDSAILDWLQSKVGK